MPLVDPNTGLPLPDKPKDTFYHGPIPPLPPGTGEAAARSYAMGKPLPTALAPSPTATPAAGPTPIPGHLEALANKLRQTKYGKMAETAGRTVEDLLVPQGKTAQAIALASTLIPGTGFLRYGENLPLVGKGLELLSELGEARTAPALSRLAIQAGAGALGSKAEGGTALSGAGQGLAAGALGEVPSILANPALYNRLAMKRFGKTSMTILHQLPGLANDIKSGKNPVIALRQMWPEANAVYGKAMEGISQDLGQLPVFKHPLKGDMDFDSFKAEIDKESKKGWAKGVPRSTDEGARARAKRANLVARMQKKLEELDNLAAQQGGISAGQPIKNLPTQASNIPGPLIRPSQPKLPASPPMRPSNLAQRFREANRQYEKAVVLSELANKKDIIGAVRFRSPKAQKIVRDEMLTKLKDKLSPLEFMDFRDAIFMGSRKGIERASRPGMLQRTGAPSVYGGGSSLRARLPIPTHENPVISQFVGHGPKTSKFLRVLGTLLGLRGERALKEQMDSQGD